jgi:Transcriptional regulatory protein, C terminal
MIFVFDEYELDLDRFELRVRGQARPVEPQVLDVLAALVRHRDRVVSKEELLDEVWHHRFVTESALTSRIKSARRAVGDDGTGSGSSVRSTAADTSSSVRCSSTSRTSYVVRRRFPSRRRPPWAAFTTSAASPSCWS